MKRRSTLRMGVVVVALLAAAFALSASAGAGPGPGPKAVQIAYMSTWDGEADIYAMDTAGVVQVNLTHDKTVGWRTDSEPAWSPGGQWVAFQRSYDKASASAGSQLYMVRSDGSGLHALTASTGVAVADSHPTWSPDGDTIVFSSNRTGHFELYSTKATGGGLARLTFTKAGVDNLEPAWSPDGSAIAFVRSIKSTNAPATASIYSLFLTTGRTYRLTTPGIGQGDFQPAWSANSDLIAFESNRAGTEDVYLIDRKGNGLVRVTRSKSNEHHPTWAPTGSRIALISDRTGATEIYTLDVPLPGSVVPPSDMKQLTFDNAFKANPAWERSLVPGPVS